jgi:hypothetical protein
MLRHGINAADLVLVGDIAENISVEEVNHLGGVLAQELS